MATPTGTFTTVLGIPVTTIEGTEGSDVLGGVKIKKNLRINAKDGNDNLTVASNSGDSLNAISVYGNAGNDRITLKSTTTGSLIQGGGGGDVIRVLSAATEVTVRGGSENDAITGVLGGTKLILNGNKGYDTLNIGRTFINSSIHGGDNDDIINIQSGILDATHIKGDKGNDTITDGGAAIDLTFRNGSKIYGNDGNDTINFSATTTSIIAQGGAGEDTITGGSGDDTLSGGSGNDQFIVNGGADTINDFGGIDTMRLTGGSVVVNVTSNRLSHGTEGIDNRVSNTAAVFIVADGINFDANQSNNIGITITAATGNSASLLFGTFGSDIINGNNGANTIKTNKGNNIITGGGGADAITGGADADIYVGAVAGQSIAATSANIVGDNYAADSVLDFNNSLDVITGFDTGGGKLRKAAGNTTNIALLTNLAGDAKTTKLDDGDGAYVLYGNFNAGNGEFTVTTAFDAADSHDALFAFGETGQTLTGVTATSWTLLLDIDDALAVGDAQQA
ncbi:calcium-binding protein [bacterium]|nr:calcium-binding protein [bacterium]